MSEPRKVWLHRRGTPYVWQFEWDETMGMYCCQQRKHLYALVVCAHFRWQPGLISVKRYVDHAGCWFWTDDTKRLRSESIEFDDGGDYRFAD